ncbi:hypothetical protein FIU70_05060, partial [Streptococcus pneumoniae]
QKRKDKICPFSSLADFNPLQLTKSQKREAPASLRVIFRHSFLTLLHHRIVHEIPLLLLQASFLFRKEL